MTTDARTRDADLLQALRAGDALGAFHGLAERYGPRVYRLCRLLLGDDAAAEDAAQDSLLRVWRALPSYDAARGALSTWLYAITRHHCLALLGRSAVFTVSLDDEAVQAAVEALPASGADDHREAGASLAALVQALPEAQRRCLQLFYWEDRSVADVAEMLGLPDNTVKTHLHRARARLRQALADQGLDDPTLWL